MPISSERQIELRTLFVQVRRETKELLGFYSTKEDAEFRRGLQASIDRMSGILDRIEDGHDVVCKKGEHPIPMRDLRELPTRTICKACQVHAEMKARAARAVEIHREKLPMYRWRSK